MDHVICFKMKILSGLVIFQWKSIDRFCFAFTFCSLCTTGWYIMLLALFRFLWLLDGAPDVHLFFMSDETESRTPTTPQSWNCGWWTSASLPSWGRSCKAGCFLYNSRLRWLWEEAAILKHSSVNYSNVLWLVLAESILTPRVFWNFHLDSFIHICFPNRCTWEEK